MDWVGNARHEVALPYNYFSKKQWHEAFELLNLEVNKWESRLNIYQWPLSLFFDRNLHIITKLSKTKIALID